MQFHTFYSVKCKIRNGHKYIQMYLITNYVFKMVTPKLPLYHSSTYILLLPLTLGQSANFVCKCDLTYDKIWKHVSSKPKECTWLKHKKKNAIVVVTTTIRYTQLTFIRPLFHFKSTHCTYVSLAMTLLPMAAWTAISNICLGIVSFRRSHMAFPALYARPLVRKQKPFRHKSQHIKALLNNEL